MYNNGEEIKMKSSLVSKMFLVLLTVVIIALFSSFALADGSCGANLTWTLKNGVLTISGTGDMEDWFITNPWEDATDDIKKVVIEPGVTSIGDFAFYQCEAMTSIEIPEGVTRIGNHAFDWCRELASVALPDSLVSIGDDAFDVCEKLTSVEVPSNVTTIGELAFGQCYNLVAVALPEGLTSIGRSAFYCCEKLASITIPSTVTVIDETPFKSCGSLKAIDVAVGSAAFTSVDGVLFSADKTTLLTYPAGKPQTKYTIPDSVIVIDRSSFYGSKNLTAVILPKGLVSIGDDAFFNCEKLSKMVVPEGVTSIGDTAFVHCYELTGISLPSTLESFGTDMFESCSHITSIDVAEGNENFTTVDDVMFNGDKTQLIAYPLGRQAASYTIPNGVTSVGDYAFLYSEYLKSITFPDSLTSIGKSAFCGCDIMTLDFPDSLVSIEYNAFNSNKAITQLRIPSSVLTLGSHAFSWCDSLVSVTIEGQYTSIDEFGVFDFGSDNLVINGLAGSTAEAYAKKEGITFNPISIVSESDNDTWICSNCKSVMKGGMFCSGCGAARPTKLKCTNCGYEPEEGTTPKFCPQCGTKFE